jgi:2-dehydro-3-deoxygalactonokinase
MEKHSIGYDSIRGVYACGMLTSKEGLAELPHLIAPAGKENFVANLAQVELPDVCPPWPVSCCLR